MISKTFTFLSGKLNPYLNSRWLPAIFAWLGVALFLVQTVWYATTGISNLDEGAYLYKGILFATGQYRPFQFFGVWTNKGPLAFLIPGYFELVFGPGLRTGRYLSIALSLLGLLGVWLTALRLSRSTWLAAASIWAFALAPEQAKIYSQGVSQGMIACMMAWILALTLGEKRPLWQLTLGGLLAGLMCMTRQNMVLVMPFLFAYIFWEHGRKSGLYSLSAGIGTMMVFHILYWPNIMQLWLPWLPRGIRALFSDLVITNIGKARWNPVVAWDTRLLSLFDGFRYHFAGFFGGLATFLLWPKRDNWKNLSHLRVIVFLGVLLVSLSALHLWASIYLDYCVYCFSGYIAFFYVVAVLLVVAAVGVWRKTANGLQQILLGLSVLAICGGVGYSAFADLGDPLLALSVPRFKDGRVMPGLTTLWETISNKFILPRDAAEKIVSAAAGLVVGIVLLLVALQVFRWLKGRNLSYGYVLGITVLIMGFALSPILAGSGIRPDCPSTNVIAANEQVGRYLQQSLPPGSKVYWNGGLSVAPLLYVPGIKIYPAQINDGYSFRVGGDPERVLKYGFWNAALSRQWLADADFVILEAWRYSAMQATLLANHFVELSRAPVPTSCADGSQLMIFHKEINGFITDRPRIQ